MLTIVGKSQTGTTFEVENRLFLSKKTTYDPQINMLTTFQVTDKVGVYGYAQVNRYWGTAYAGLSFNVAKWFTLQVGVGSETDSIPIRFNTNLLFTVGNFSSLQVYEYGGSGFYCNVITGLKLSPTWTAGFIIKTLYPDQSSDYGIGPFVSYAIKNSPFNVIIAPFYDPKPTEGMGHYNLMGVLQFNFYK